MKLSRRPITRTDAITVGLGALAGTVAGFILGGVVGGPVTAVGFALLFSISGSLAGTLFCFCREPGNTIVSPKRITVFLFALVTLLLSTGVVDHFSGRSRNYSNVISGCTFAIIGFMCLAASRKKKKNDIGTG